MNVQEKDKILEVFDILANTELSLAELYETCSRVWKIDTEFWSGIARDERKHNEYIKKMSQIISQFPDQFTQQVPFKPIALQTTIHTNKTVARKVDSNQITRKEIFDVARDIEKSVIESKYDDIVQTHNADYKNLVKIIITDTYEHKDMIEQKIRDLQKAIRFVKD